MAESETIERQKTEDTFAVDGEYIAEQAREALRVFFLPVSSVARAARVKSRAIRREARKVRGKAA